MQKKKKKKKKRNSKITRTTFDIKFYVKLHERKNNTDRQTTHTKLTVKND